MKTLFFAAALMLGSAALAQTGNTVDDPSQSSGARGITQQGTDPNGEACSPPGYNAGGGYPPCGAGMGGNAAGGANPDGTASTPGGMASTSLPPCTRTVTDRCQQTYERGVRRR